MLVPIYILVMGFPTKMAIPLSNVTIFGGAAVNMMLNVQKRHPHADRPLVDWDLILVMEPLTIGGAICGVFLNKLLPELVLGVLLVALLSFTAFKTYNKGVKTYNKETKELERNASRAAKSALAAAADEENDGGEGDSLLAGEEGGDEAGAAAGAGGSGIPATPEEQELAEVLAAESVTPMEKVGTLVAVFVVVIVANLLKGGGAFPSPLGVECGTLGYWTLTASMFVWLLVVSAKVRVDLIKAYEQKRRIGFKYVEGDVQWDAKATIRYPGLCFFAGFFAGMFGIGGGIIKGPLMLEMGVHPAVSSATSACMILFTSFTACTSYWMFGLLEESYLPCMVTLGLCATLVGQLGINEVVKRTGRSSYIILSIGSVVGLSAVMMGAQTFFAMAMGKEEQEASFCEAGE